MTSTFSDRGGQHLSSSKRKRQSPYKQEKVAKSSPMNHVTSSGFVKDNGVGPKFS